MNLGSLLLIIIRANLCHLNWLENQGVVARVVTRAPFIDAAGIRKVMRRAKVRIIASIFIKRLVRTFLVLKVFLDGRDNLGHVQGGDETLRMIYDSLESPSERARATSKVYLSCIRSVHVEDLALSEGAPELLEITH